MPGPVVRRQSHRLVRRRVLPSQRQPFSKWQRRLLSAAQLNPDRSGAGPHPHLGIVRRAGRACAAGPAGAPGVPALSGAVGRAELVLEVIDGCYIVRDQGAPVGSLLPVPDLEIRLLVLEIPVEEVLRGADLGSDGAAVDGGLGGPGGKGEAAGCEGADGCAVGYEG